jgi:beta-lactamase class A
MVQMLRSLERGNILTPAKRAYLYDVMARCATGKNRIRGMLSGVPIAHKTGTLNNYASDVGFITLPDGRRLAVAFFARGGTDRPATIARAARTIYDGFSGWVRSLNFADSMSRALSAN